MTQQMRFIGLLTLCGLMTGVAPTLAHEGKAHVMGTVRAIDAARMTVQTREGQSVSIRLSGETKYLNGDAPARSGDVGVGSRVVVDVAGSAENPEATQVRFSSAGNENEHEPGDHAGHQHDGE